MRNLTLLTDFYELTMMQAYFLQEKNGGVPQEAVFDMFYREDAALGGFAIAAGLEQFVEYIIRLKFSDEDIQFLRASGIFKDEFLAYLAGFRFTGDIAAVTEGTVIFPGAPFVRITAPIMQAQLIETTLLNIVNHQTLVATKAARVCHAAAGRRVIEFGLRRAQGPDAGLYGARAAFIGGCESTSNVLAARLFGMPMRGTHAHSWVMSFDTELEAFREYARLYPMACILLVDTYDTLKSGVPNAIRVFTEMRDSGNLGASFGIRLDSGDMAYLSKQARKMLDAAGFSDAFISASNDLDEHLIAELLQQGAAIDVWGVGTSLITSRDTPALGGVYKLAALRKQGESDWQPKMKISNNPAKVTNPGVKQVWRLYDAATGKMRADLLTLHDEEIDTTENLTIFDPVDTWKQLTLKAGQFTAQPLLQPIFSQGKCVYTPVPLAEIKAHATRQLDTLWEEHRRLVRPQKMYVDLSRKLYNLKQNILKEV